MFSLIELLIIISVLIVLASLLSPSLKSMLGRAKLLGCSEHLRGIGAGYHMYADDNDDYVADCLFIGSTHHTSIWTNDSDRNYRAAYNIGRFHEGRAGYLEPYLGINQESFYCPGSDFAQGVEAFGTSRFARGLATYTSLSPFNFMIRKRVQDYVINPYTDERNGWDHKSIRPVYLDPLMSMSAWYRGREGQGGRWDQVGLVIHGNQGLMPVLMSDGHVMFPDRISYPTQFISQTGYTNRTAIINWIYDEF